jgi:hypothetical protein
MAERDESTKPHGDPLEGLVDLNPEDNRAQAESDAPSDAQGEPRGDRVNTSDRADGKGSDANGVPAFDEAEGEERKTLYRDGATIVSRID